MSVSLDPQIFTQWSVNGKHTENIFLYSLHITLLSFPFSSLLLHQYTLRMGTIRCQCSVDMIDKACQYIIVYIWEQTALCCIYYNSVCAQNILNIPKWMRKENCNCWKGNVNELLDCKTQIGCLKYISTLPC